MYIQGLTIALISIFLTPRAWLYFEQKLPTFDTPHPHFHLKQLWSQDELSSLRNMVKNLTMPTAAEDIAYNGMQYTMPKMPSGECPHRYMIAYEKDRCVMPQRIDAVSHYFTYGGRYGAKERYPQLVSNVNNILFHFDNTATPELNSLFESHEYKSATAAICGKNYPVMEKVQAMVSINLPGQEFPHHHDLAWFTFGANRRNTPLWLLVVMASSGLWEDALLPQVNGVAYIHQNDSIDGGDFFFFPYGPGKEATVLPADANSAILLNGVRVVHGMQRFVPAAVAPMNLEPASLSYNMEEDTFELKNSRQELLAANKFHNHRIALIWRSVCFKTEAERDEWEQNKKTYDPENALKVLEADLRKRGRLGIDEPRPESLMDFSLLLLDEYVKYPVDNYYSAWFPFNYCMLPFATENQYLRGVLQAGINLIC